MALKLSDLGHLAAPLAVHLRWVRGLEEEFFRQGDKEKACNLPISPLFDRSKPGVTKSQVRLSCIVPSLLILVQSLELVGLAWNWLRVSKMMGSVSNTLGSTCLANNFFGAGTAHSGEHTP